VVYACRSKTSQTTYLIAEEPLTPSIHSPVPPDPFRRYATITIPGHATDIVFYRHTLAVVTDKQIVIAEPGNPAYAIMPSPLDEQPDGIGQQVGRFCARPGCRALGLYQVSEWEFVMVWDWGACFVNRSEYTFICHCRAGEGALKAVGDERVSDEQNVYARHKRCSKPD
jgi:hypothetical protein